MIKYIFAVPDNGKIQLYNTDGSKCEDNKIDGAVMHEIHYDHGMELPQIKITYILRYVANEDEIDSYLT